MNISKRVTLVDGLRGLSLLGILLANLLIFQYGIWGVDKLSFSGLDGGALTFTKVFIEHSFMPIFTFLFGFSIIKMANSLKRKDLKVKRYFARRFLLLAILGILHNIYLWEGDILFVYGMMGFLLLFFINRTKRTILIWGITLVVLLNSLMLIGVALDDSTLDEEDEVFEVSEAYLAKTNEVYAKGTYWEIYEHRNSEEPMEDESGAILLLILVMAPFMTAPMFLFGMYAAHINLFSNPFTEEKLYKIASLVLIPLGLFMKTVDFLEISERWGDFLGINGAPILAVGYIFAFAWLYTKFPQSIFMQSFESVGKLSLTNYLMQTVICTTIFYGYGFGLFNKLGTLNGIILAIFIFSLQCVASHFYLKFFRRGPIEFVLRMWTNLSWNGNAKPKKSTQVNINEMR